jgi:acetyltransferase-like isoleucine patch superfamily enzyme
MSFARAVFYWAVVCPGVLAAFWERHRRARGCLDFSGFNMAFALLPGVPGNWIRKEYYRRSLKKCGRNVQFKFGSFCQYYAAEFGDNVMFGYFNSIGEVQIGSDVVVGGFVNFLSGLNQHGHKLGPVPFWRQPGDGRRKIIIGSNVWIGSNACIAASLGSSVVVAAGSVVIREVESCVIVGGNPARKIGEVS